jgi:uncharacterized membrane protein YcaP (DUF421 family)
MSGDYKSISEGLLLVSTILGWNMLIDVLVYLVPALRRVLEPPPLLLIDHGKLLRRHMRMEFISEEELNSKLRAHGVQTPGEVEKAYMEPDGEVTVLKKK